MKKNGFTLVEILAVLVLVSVITIIVIPSTIKYINNKKNEISDVTANLIYSGTDLYMDANKEDYPELPAGKHCIQLKDVVNFGLLEAPIMDSVSGKEIDLNKYVKVSYVYDEDMATVKKVFSIVEDCSICKGVTVATTGTVPSTTEGFTPGDEYMCEVKDETSYRFFVLGENEFDSDKVDLIMEKSIASDGTPEEKTIWCDNSNKRCSWVRFAKDEIYDATPDNTSNGIINGCDETCKVPTSALDFINKATSDWINLEYIDEEYIDENLPANNTLTSNQYNGYGTIKLNGYARLPKLKEIISNSVCPTTTPIECATAGWLHNYLNYEKDSNKYMYAYWTLSTSSDYTDDSDKWYVNYSAFYVRYDGKIYHSYYPHLENKSSAGVRPVITVSKKYITDK